MSGEPVDPGAVAPADAATVLAALNAAGSAEELGALVELPDELDVGVRVAARVLARRDELGGFTTLEQVAAVPLVGPERFTEIVLALTGRVPRAPAAGGLAGEVAALRAQVRRLTALLEPAPAVALHAPAGAWVGLPVEVRVSVTAPPPRELIVVCGAGTLRSASRGDVEQGMAVRVLTGLDGAASLTWRPPASPPLEWRHTAALTAALPVLGDAPIPQAASAALDRLALRYDQEAEVAFREAVDALAAPPLPAAAAGTWPEEHVVVQAVSTDGGPVGVAVLVLRSWIGALADALARLLDRTSRLDSHLATEAGRGLPAVELGAAVQRRIAGYLAQRRGVLGREAARSVAEAATGRLLSERVAALPLEQREALVPLLTGAARTVRRGPVEVLGVVESTTTVTRRVAGRPADLAELSERVDGLAATLDGRVSDVEARLRRKADLGTFENLLGRIREIENRIGR